MSATRVRCSDREFAPRIKPIGDVVGDGHVREQRVILKHDPDFAAVGRETVDDAATDHDLALRLLEETGDDPEQCRLPAPGRPEKRHELSTGDFQRDVIDGQSVTVAVGYAIQRQRLTDRAVRRTGVTWFAD